MRALVIGDIGVVDGMVHLGDEAMFEAAVGHLRCRGVDVVAVSSAPDESATRYGVDSVPRLGFVGLQRDAARARARMLVAAASVGLPAEDPAAAVLRALRSSDGLVNAGGGNLASRWPVHVYERAALAGMAAAAGVPVVVSGQTLGPDLDQEDAATLSRMLHSAALSSVREPASLALAGSWGVDARLTVDDASFLGWDGGRAARRGVLVSVSGWFAGRPSDETESALARLVDRAAEIIGGPVMFHAHYGPADPRASPRGDAAVHERVRARMRTSSEVVPTGDSRTAAALARSAALLITGRYHPAVFAAPAGVPTLGVTADVYTDTKLRGALGHWSTPTLASLDDLDGAAAAVTSLHEGRARIGEEAASRLPAHRAATTRWWDAVADVIAG